MGKGWNVQTNKQAAIMLANYLQTCEGAGTIIEPKEPIGLVMGKKIKIIVTNPNFSHCNDLPEGWIIKAADKLSTERSEDVVG